MDEDFEQAVREKNYERAIFIARDIARRKVIASQKAYWEQKAREVQEKKEAGKLPSKTKEVK